jgi:hypothetical protein
MMSGNDAIATYQTMISYGITRATYQTMMSEDDVNAKKTLGLF